MRALLIGTVLAPWIALPALAQTQQQHDLVFQLPDTTDDQTIAGCSAVIGSPSEATNQAGAYRNRGLSYDNKGQFDQAIADYNQAVVIDPNFAEAYISRGVAYSHKRLYDIAITDYTHGIALKPGYALGYANRASIYYRKSQYDLAIADDTQAIGLDANDFQAFLTRSAAHYEKGLYDQAIADAARAIELKPNDAQRLRQSRQGPAQDRAGHSGALGRQ